MSDAALVVATLEPRTILLRDGNHPGTTASKAPHVLVIDGDQRISLVGIVNGVHALPGGRATRPKPIGHGLHGIADRSQINRDRIAMQVMGPRAGNCRHTRYSAEPMATMIRQTRIKLRKSPTTERWKRHSSGTAATIPAPLRLNI